MSQKTITIFGGSGFLGRYVINALAKEGHVLRIGVRNARRANFLKTAGRPGQISLHPLSIADEKAVEELVAGSDIVINLVGILYPTARQKFYRLHHWGAKNIALAAAKHHVETLIHVSAIGADCKAKATYARSKGFGEKAVQDNFGRPIILRPSLVFGQEDQFFNRFAMMTKWFPFLPLIGGGKTRFQPVYVGDIAKAISKILQNPTPFYGKIFELGGPRIYTFKELLVYIQDMIGIQKYLMPVPFWAAKLKGYFLQQFPKPLLTADQVKLLQQDNVVDTKYRGFHDLGMVPTAMEAIVPQYLARFRRGGQWAKLGAKLGTKMKTKKA